MPVGPALAENTDVPWANGGTVKSYVPLAVNAALNAAARQGLFYRDPHTKIDNVNLLGLIDANARVLGGELIIQPAVRYTGRANVGDESTPYQPCLTWLVLSAMPRTIANCVAYENWPRTLNPLTSSDTVVDIHAVQNAVLLLHER